MTFRTFALRATFVLVVGTLIAALWYYRKTFMLAFLAVVIAVLMSIIVGYLQRLRVPRAVAGLAFGLLGVVLALSVVLVREVYSYGLLGLRGRSVPADLPPPPPHTRSPVSRRFRALRQRSKSRG